MTRRRVAGAVSSGSITGPGIVPVYELGRCADRRPYFTLKLVKGRTLDELRKERPDSAHDWPRFLTIFEQVCQTVAYAHCKSVVLRHSSRICRIVWRRCLRWCDGGMTRRRDSRQRRQVVPAAAAYFSPRRRCSIALGDCLTPPPVSPDGSGFQE